MSSATNPPNPPNQPTNHLISALNPHSRNASRGHRKDRTAVDTEAGKGKAVRLVLFKTFKQLQCLRLATQAKDSELMKGTDHQLVKWLL